MPLLPVTFPPGLLRNGTRYQSKGRWYSCNRVRWHDGAIRPIGGWERTKAPDGVEYPAWVASTTVAIRDGLASRTNNKNRSLVMGSNEYVLRADPTTGAFTDMSPVGMEPGTSIVTTPAAKSGGLGPASNEADPLVGAVARWSFDTWGENILGMPDWGTTAHRTIYEATTGGVLTAIPGAPVGLVDFITTQERMIMTIGSDSELRRVKWCDQENNTDWAINDLTNQAGEFVLPGSGRMIGIYKLRDQNVILTETDIWVARFIGPPYVYSFVKVGDIAPPFHRKAATVLPSGVLVWVGARNAWIYDGQVQELPCEVIDYWTNDIEASNASKIFAWVNPEFSEIWWHYAGNDADTVEGEFNREPNKYVMWNWELNAWSIGYLDRQMAVSRGAYSKPMLLDSFTGLLYDHEIATAEYIDDTYDDSTFETDRGMPSVTSGPIELGSGDTGVAVRYLYPDLQATIVDDQVSTMYPAPVDFFFEGRQMPTGPLTKSIVYHASGLGNQPVPTRVTGRELMLTVYGDIFTFEGNVAPWEWGNFRLDIAPSGTGRR